MTSKNGNPLIDSAKLLICLIPLLCAYVDLISLHVMIRVITIGIYLKIYGNNYERYVFAVRLRSGANPFVFEAVALHGSSIVFNAIIILLGLTLSQAFGHSWLRPWLNPVTVSGVLGIAVTVLLWIIYVIRAQGVIDLADGFKRSEDAARAATG